MRQKLLEILACPDCHGSLTCEGTSRGDEIEDGHLTCDACSVRYPIVNGIPRFVPAENYALSFGYQWNRFKQEQIDSLNGIRQSERRLMTETGWDTEWMKGKWILDAGCGAGRFLEVASRAQCDVVGVDLSNAVDAARETLSGRTNVHLVQASIYSLPFRPGSFDGVYCIGVIQHTPEPLRTVRALPAMLKEGGRIAMTIYERRRFTPFYSKYWFRPLTRRMNQRVLLGALRAVMPIAFPVTEVLFRLPVVGRVFQFVIPVTNYVHDPELSMRQRYQWAVMDTFDMLAPAYDQPQREEDVRRVLESEGVWDVRRLGNPGLNLVGTKGAAAHRSGEGEADRAETTTPART